MGDSEKRAVLLPVDDAETDDDQWEYYDDSTTLCDFWQVCILSLRHYASEKNIPILYICHLAQHPQRLLSLIFRLSVGVQQTRSANHIIILLICG